MFTSASLVAFLAFTATAQGSFHDGSRARGLHSGKRRMASEGKRDLVGDLVGDLSGITCGPAAQLINGILSVVPCPSSSSTTSTAGATSTSTTSATSSSTPPPPSSDTPTSTSSSAAPKSTCDANGNLLDALGNIILDLLGQPEKCSGSSTSSTSSTQSTSPAVNTPSSTSASTTTSAPITSTRTSSAPASSPTCDANGNLLDALGNIILNLLGQPEKCSNPSSSSSSPSVQQSSSPSVQQSSSPAQQPSSSNNTPSSTTSSQGPAPTCDANGNLINALGALVLNLLGQPQPCNPSTPSSSTQPSSSSKPTTPSSTSSAASSTPTCDANGNLVDALGNVISNLLGQKCTPPSSSTPSSTTSSSSAPNNQSSAPPSSTKSSPSSAPTCDANGNLIDSLGNLVLGLLGQKQPCNPVSSSSSQVATGVSSTPTSNGPTSSGPASSSPFSVNFPTMTSSSVVPTSTQSVTGTGSATSTGSSSSVDSAWLNVPSSSLLQNSVSSTASATLTNPDQAASTLSLVPSQSGIPDAPLPSGLPVRILPPAGQGIDPNADLAGQELVSILFDDSLGWNFEVTTSKAPGQMFFYFPQTISNALGIPISQVQTLYLQAYKPTSYTGPQDIDQLGTMFLAYLPNATVPLLSAQLKARNSPFYTNSTGVAAALAAHVDSSFSINSVQNPNGMTPDANSASAAMSNTNQTKQDVIIGVVSALAGIALIILAVLVYKSHQRRQELAHRRLSDSDVAGIRPENRDFDQDTIGNPRRRSFFFAQDSLGGPTSSGNTVSSSEGYSYTNNGNTVSPEQMRQRSPINAALISAPHLQQSSMNW